MLRYSTRSSNVSAHCRWVGRWLYAYLLAVAAGGLYKDTATTDSQVARRMTRRLVNLPKCLLHVNFVCILMDKEESASVIS